VAQIRDNFDQIRSNNSNTYVQNQKPESSISPNGTPSENPNTPDKGGGNEETPEG